MLDERVNKYSELGSFEELYFLWECLSVDAPTKESISLRFQLSNKSLRISIKGSLLLLQEMNIICQKESAISINSKFKKYTNCSLKDFDNWFPIAFLQFTLSEGIVDLTKIKYNISNDKYILAKSAISLRHACYRNLLISLQILSSPRPNGDFSIERFISLFTKEISLNHRKKTLEQLLKDLERKQEEGEAGEQFVLKYERIRLNGHPMINRIKQISVIDTNAGYDIVSYNGLSSTQLDRFLEVKTYSGVPHFYWSHNEKEKASLLREHYFIYLVDYSQINECDYQPIIIQDPCSFFKNHNKDWIIETDTVKITKKLI